MQRYKDFAPTGFDCKGLNADLFDIGEWFVAPCGRNRDSREMEESNFDQCLEALGGESDTVQVRRFGHWACGWFEIIILDAKQADKVAIALGLESRLENYPMLDEADVSQREWDSATENWAQMSVRARVEYLQRAHGCVFAARRAEFPADNSGRLFELLTRD